MKGQPTTSPTSKPTTGQAQADSFSIPADESIPETRARLFYSDYFLIGLLLAAALLGAWLPVDWTRDLKRPQQAPNYAWLNLVYCLFYIAAGWWLLGRPAAETRYRRAWLPLVLLVGLPNLFNIWLRYTAPLGPADPRPLFGRDADMGLYYQYGLALGEGRWPVNSQGQFAEYPQLSFPLFWLGAALAGPDREAFYWIFPLLLLVFQAGAAAALYGLGLKLGRARTAFLLAAFAAGCPALYLFSYTRFDIVPAALLLGAVYCLVPGRLAGVAGLAERRRWQRLSVLAGFLLAAGTLVKWLPGVLWPWPLLAAWRTGNRPVLIRFGLASAGFGLLATLPWLAVNAPALLYPYRFQGSRRLIGESVWFLFQYAFFDPARAIPDKPWGEPPRVLLGNTTLLLVQLALTGLVLGLSLWRLWRAQAEQAAFSRWAAAGLVAVAVFTLSNRIFSPQYLALLVWVWAASLLLRPAGRLSLAAGLALTGLAAWANFEVYLLGAYSEIWLRDSAVLFAAGYGLSGWLLWRALSGPAEG